MSIQMQGVIHGSRIELEREPGLPSGSTVIVNIEPKPVSLEEMRQHVEVLCDAWAQDPSLELIFDEIARGRAATLPREVNFDMAS